MTSDLDLTGPGKWSEPTAHRGFISERRKVALHGKTLFYERMNAIGARLNPEGLLEYLK